MIELPPPLILPAHFEGNRPAIIRPEIDLARYFPVEFSRGQRRAIFAELRRAGRVEAMLPGMVPVIAGNGPSLSFTFVGSANGSNTSIGISSISPGTRQSGDLCFILNNGRTGSGLPAAVTPTGFTNLRNTGGGELRSMISAKILNGSETTLTGINGGSWQAWSVLVLRPSLAVASFADNDTGNNEVTSGDPAAQTITTSGATSTAVAYGFMSTRAVITSPSFGTMTEYVSRDGFSGQNGHRGHYQIFNPGDPRVNITYDLGNSGNTDSLQSGWLSFTLA